MGEQRSQRRLAAILAADVAGYSALMEKDEERTHSAFRLCRAVITEVVAAHHGRIFGGAGDSVMVEFTSPVEAVRAGLEIQDRLAVQPLELPEGPQMQFRIGINLGDVMVDRGELFGDGVNVAARLQAMAEPGGICLSGGVYEHLGHKLPVTFEDLGFREMKNIAKPVRVYRVTRMFPQASLAPSPLATPAKPSIAVLPFANLSSDTEQEFFADGLTEDLITDLSRSDAILVTARNSCFAYKGKSIDVRRIAGELGVRYVLEGSARRASQRVRINVQLIDALTGNHLWAERYDRSLDDVFSVQDEVTAKIVEALAGRLVQRRPRTRPKSMEAWDCCVMARRLNEQSPLAAREARVLLERALEIDPDYAEAHRWLAMNLANGWIYWGEPIEPTRRLSIEDANRAVQLDPNDSGCHWVCATILYWERKFEDAEQEFAKALELDPEDADCWATKSDMSVLSGYPQRGLEEIERAFLLNPISLNWYHILKGQALYALGRYDEAVQTLRQDTTHRVLSRRYLAASLAQLGRMDEARREAKLFMATSPEFRISHWASTQPFQDKALLEKVLDGYRKAGLPE